MTLYCFNHTFGVDRICIKCGISEIDYMKSQFINDTIWHSPKELEIINMKQLPKWDLRFLEMAKLVSSWSKDWSTKVGAVISIEKDIIKIGYNGPPPNFDDSLILDDREYKNSVSNHAEINALLMCYEKLDNCQITTFPMLPCDRCAAAIAKTGIKRVVGPISNNERWIDSINKSKDLFNKCGIEVVEYDFI